MSAELARAYLTGWGIMCLVALLLLARDLRVHAVATRAYWQALLTPWKVVTFLVAATGITVVAPYTGDPTWDHVDASFMSLLAFTSAPWTVGTMYGVAMRGRPWRQGYVAACVWLFSASWSYDLYLLMRDGYYPVTWLANLAASSVLYLCAGLFWSLDWSPARGMTFAFTELGWPQPPAPGAFRRILVPAALFMALVAGMILYLLKP
jgi:hypothetical protein